MKHKLKLVSVNGKAPTRRKPRPVPIPKADKIAECYERLADYLEAEASRLRGSDLTGEFAGQIESLYDEAERAMRVSEAFLNGDLKIVRSMKGNES